MIDVRAVPYSAFAFVIAATACAQGVGGDGFAPSAGLTLDASAMTVLDGPELRDAPGLRPSSDSDLDASGGVAATTPENDAPAEATAAPTVRDGAADAWPGTRPSVGDLLITEVMFYPSGLEPEAEWFEVHNLTGSPVLLSGLTIQDGYPRTHTIASVPAVVAPPYAYVLLVRDLASARNSALPVTSIVYEYGGGLPPDQGVVLENDAGGAISLWDGNTALADIPYGSWGLAVGVGQSIEITTLRYTGSDTPASWCVARFAWAIGADDGTPGAPSDCP